MSCHRTVLSILCIVGLVAAGAFSSDDFSLQASPPFAEKSSSPQPPRREVKPKANELPGETEPDEERPSRIYERTLTRIDAPQPLLADHPDFIEPITGTQRFSAPRLVDDEKADLSVRPLIFRESANQHHRAALKTWTTPTSTPVSRQLTDIAKSFPLCPLT